MNYLTETEQPMNSLIQAALLQKYYGTCPNKERVKKYCSQGIYPRWAAGYITAPVILIFERPGNQHYLCESGQDHISLTSFSRF